MPVRNTCSSWPKFSSSLSVDRDITEPNEAELASRSWEPLWLRRPFLITSTVLFLLLLAILVAVSEVSRSEEGIRISTSSHYVRTYAPTAVLILLSSAWRQVDFHCKQLTPWKVLYHGESPAEKSVLLDYISPLQVTSFIKAWKNRHWAVVCSVAGYALLKVLTVAATALFTEVDISLSAERATVQKIPFADGLDISLNDLRAIGPTVSYEAFGTSSQRLAERTGLTSSFLYEILDSSSFRSDGRYSLQTQVRGLSPIFECQNAPFQVIFPASNITDVNPETRVELLFPECTLRGGNGQGTPIYSLNPSITKVPPRQLSPLRQQIDCLNQTDANWQLLTLVDFRYNQTLDSDDSQAAMGQSVSASSWFTSIASSIGVACRSRYEMNNVDLEYSKYSVAAPALQVRRATAATETLPGLFDADIGGIVDSALRAGATMAGSLLQGSYDEEYPNTLFKIMAGAINGTYSSLLSEEAMLSAAQLAMRQLALQGLDRHLRLTQLVSGPATINPVQSRLRVNEVPAIVTLVGFGLLALLSAGLVWLAPRHATPHNPEELASAAIILQDSPALQSILLRIKLANRKLKEGLKGFLFASGLGYSQLPKPRCGILVNKQGESSPLIPTDGDPGLNSENTTRWYRPATGKKLLLIIFMLLPLAIIGSLGAVQHVSDSNNGFAVVADPNNPIIVLLPQVLSALVMLSVAAAFSSIEFNVLMLAPIHQLLGSQESSSEALLLGYLGRIPPVVLFAAFSRRHWVVFLLTISALIGSSLTLVASGLYTLRELDDSALLDIQQLDQLTTTWQGSALNDNDAAIIQSLVESADLGYPEFTYRELAFPKAEAAVFKVQNESQDTLLEVPLPAMRASINCTFLDPLTYNFTTDFNARIRTTRAQLSASVPLPADCPFGGPGGNESTLEFTSTVTMSGNASYIGKLLDLHVGPYDAILGSPAGELNPNSNPDNPPTCPTLAFWYGHASLTNPAQTAASLLICYQQLDLLETTTTFTLPNMSISTQHPPRINTTTPTHPFSLLNSPSHNHPFRPQLHFDNTFTSLDAFILSTTSPLTPSSQPRTCTFRHPTSEIANQTFDLTAPSLDPFFQGVLCASSALQAPLPVEFLGLTDAASRRRVFDGIQAFYRRYMAIAVGRNMRRALSVEAREGGVEGLIGPGGRVQGTVLNARRVVRLVQQRNVKWVLQGMLGVMVLCGGGGVWLCRLWRPVVQWEVGSMVGRMMVFVGTGVGEGCREVWEGIDGTGTVEKWRLREVLERWEWRLGWWDAGRERGVSGDVWGVRPLERGEKVGLPVGVVSKVRDEDSAKRPQLRIVGVERSCEGWI